MVTSFLSVQEKNGMKERLKVGTSFRQLFYG